MKRKFISIILMLQILSLLSRCYYYDSEKTEIYYIEDYIIDNTGVEIEHQIMEKKNGFFANKENVYPCSKK